MQGFHGEIPFDDKVVCVMTSRFKKCCILTL